jgi:hypothetical protein
LADFSCTGCGSEIRIFYGAGSKILHGVNREIMVKTGVDRLQLHGLRIRDPDILRCRIKDPARRAVRTRPAGLRPAGSLILRKKNAWISDPPLECSIFRQHRFIIQHLLNPGHYFIGQHRNHFKRFQVFLQLMHFGGAENDGAYMRIFQAPAE